MSLLQLIPNIFYTELETGLKFFNECLGFTTSYQDSDICIIKRDNITIKLVKDAELANADRPEIRIVTDNIEEIYSEIKTRNANILHPNLNIIKEQPWGLKEFAVLDPTTVCVIFQQG